jgi:hypothetical protein
MISSSASRNEDRGSTGRSYTDQGGGHPELLHVVAPLHCLTGTLHSAKSQIAPGAKHLSAQRAPGLQVIEHWSLSWQDAVHVEPGSHVMRQLLDSRHSRSHVAPAAQMLSHTEFRQKCKQLRLGWQLVPQLGSSSQCC